MNTLESRSTKKSTELTLIDKLSRLSYQQTVKLLGNNAPKLLRSFSNLFICSPAR